MRFWDRATSEATGDRKEKTVRARLTNRQVSSTLRVFGQRPPFSNSSDPSVYKEGSLPSLGDEIQRPVVVPVDLTAGNLGDTLLSTSTGAVVSGAGATASFSNADVVGEPDYAEITAIFGTPAAVGPGFIGVIDDNAFHTAMFLCISDGVLNWHIEALKKIAP